MIERFGWTRYIADCGAQIVDYRGQDTDGSPDCRFAWRVAAREGSSQGAQPIEMINSTPEADGTCKHYLERIDPKAYNGDTGRLCHATMASRLHHRDYEGRLVRTFSRWQDYQPTAER